MSVAGVPIDIKSHFQITTNDANQICVKQMPPDNNAAPLKMPPACYVKKSLDGPVNPTDVLKAKYAALSYMVAGELFMWVFAYKVKYPSGPEPTDDQQQQVMDTIFSQLPYASLCPLEDNGAAWTVDVFTMAIKAVLPAPPFHPLNLPLSCNRSLRNMSRPPTRTVRVGSGWECRSGSG